MLYSMLQSILTSFFRIYYRPRLVNQNQIPLKGPAVLAGNHKHALDPVLVTLCTKRRVFYLAKKSLCEGPFGWFFRLLHVIPVDRGAAHNPDAVEAAVSHLKNGEIIDLSPEGTRNRTTQLLLPFKYGAVVMAKKSKAPIIPYAIVGEYRFQSKNLAIIFGEPFMVTELEIEEANQLLYERVRDLLETYGN